MSESIKQIDFNTFSSVCRYRSEYHCPFYGCRGEDVRIYVGDRLVATAENVNFHLVG